MQRERRQNMQRAEPTRRLAPTRDAETTGALPAHRAAPTSAHAMLKLQGSAGNRAVARLLSGEPARPSPTGRAAVQRLMSVESFKSATAGKGRSSSDVSNFDALLAAYARLGRADGDLSQRKQRLLEMKAAADVYVGKKVGGARTPGVNRLLDDVAAERKFVDPLADAVLLIAGQPVQAFEKIIEGQDAYLEAEQAGRTLPRSQEPDFFEMIGRSRRAMGEAARDTGMKQIIARDLARITHMSTDGNVDPLMRSILVEVLANTGLTHFQETKGIGSGAVLSGAKDRAKGIDKKYRVDVAMEQGQGSAERVSSLVHEMTHVAIQQKFANTAIHLAFKKTASEGEILALSAKRTREVKELEDALAADGARWTSGQRGVLLSKIKYPVEGKNTLGSYADTFFKKGDLTVTERDRVVDLQGKGANNTLIEFDTVINQMMFLMTAWNVPATDPFYVVLKRVAQDAYDYRSA